MESQTLILLLSFSLAVFYFCVYLGFISQFRSKYNHPNRLKLSLIIALKNEEKNIGMLLRSLDSLDYPKDDLEIIFVDDNSSDNTYEMLKKQLNPDSNYYLLKADNKEIIGKKGALTIGIRKATNNYIVITDADCRPESGWLNRIAVQFSAGYDFIFGIAPIKNGKLFVQKLSAFESFRNTYLTLAATGLKIPYSAAARSFAFKKSSFEKLGGYANTTETISGDDDLLLREAVKYKMKIGTITGQDAFVFSDAPDTFKKYFNQKKRHLQTSFHYLLKQKVFLAAWHIINLLSLFSFLLIFISPLLVVPFIIKIISDFIIVSEYQVQLGHKFKFYEIPFLQIAFEIFLIINFLNSLTGKVEWK